MSVVNTTLPVIGVASLGAVRRLWQRGRARFALPTSPRFATQRRAEPACGLVVPLTSSSRVLAWGALALSVLGPCELRRDGELLLVPAGRTTELLIRLALDAGVPVGLQTPRNTMQPKVSKLRRALGDPSLVTSSSGGYALAVNRGTVDAFAAVELRPVDESARAQQRTVHYKGQAGFDHVRDIDPVPVHCGRPLPGGLPALRGGLRASRAWSR
jgi:hypothetical protein